MRGALTALMREQKLKYNLLSYYYIKENANNFAFAELVRDNSEEILIDSGAHSFQKGKRVDWDAYTQSYADWIRDFDRPNVVGYFEMDVDNILGYDKVLELRAVLEAASDKIIPVWHKNRGIDDFKKMCQQYAGKVVAITGFKNEDIRDDQYLMFVKYAREWGCRVHCLGMTRRKILDKVPFDYTDSSSWLQMVVYGSSMAGDRLPVVVGDKRQLQYKLSYLQGMKMQEDYYQKWRKVCND